MNDWIQKCDLTALFNFLQSACSDQKVRQNVRNILYAFKHLLLTTIVIHFTYEDTNAQRGKEKQFKVTKLIRGRVEIQMHVT